MASEIRDAHPGIFAAVRLTAVPIERDLIRCLVHWLGDFIRLKQQSGQAGVPEGVVAAQTALAEAYAASGSRQNDELSCRQEEVSRRQDEIRPMSEELVASTYEVGTGEAAAALGISADGVRKHIHRGNLVSRKVGRQLMVTVASVESLKARLMQRKVVA